MKERIGRGSGLEDVGVRRIVAERAMGARGAAVVTHTATGYAADVVLEAGGASAGARSILGLLALGVCQGDSVVVRASGHEAAEALEAVSDALESIIGGARVLSEAGWRVA